MFDVIVYIVYSIILWLKNLSDKIEIRFEFNVYLNKKDEEKREKRPSRKKKSEKNVLYVKSRFLEDADAPDDLPVPSKYVE